MKDAVFLGSVLSDITAFPTAARRSAGYEIDQIQRGEAPRDWKPFSEVGAGVREIRIHAEGEFRILYVATFAEAVYVIHAFRKKTQKTPQAEVDLAAKRFRALARYRKERDWV